MCATPHSHPPHPQSKQTAPFRSLWRPVYVHKGRNSRDGNFTSYSYSCPVFIFFLLKRKIATKQTCPRVCLNGFCYDVSYTVLNTRSDTENNNTQYIHVLHNSRLGQRRFDTRITSINNNTKSPHITQRKIKTHSVQYIFFKVKTNQCIIMPWVKSHVRDVTSVLSISFFDHFKNYTSIWNGTLVSCIISSWQALAFWG